MGSADRANYVCVRCGRWYGHKGKCDHCGHFLKADRLLSEEDSERLMELAQGAESVITSPGSVCFSLVASSSHCDQCYNDVVH